MKYYYLGHLLEKYYDDCQRGVLRNRWDDHLALWALDMLEADYSSPALLEAAGGFGAEAGREAVNLADWVSDGQKLYFPKEGEAVEEPQAQADSASGLVTINSADVAALCTLPGIGESRAQDIISYREANGGFGACEDIMKVSGIKTAAYEKIKDKITVK